MSIVAARLEMRAGGFKFSDIFEIGAFRRGSHRFLRDHKEDLACATVFDRWLNVGVRYYTFIFYSLS